MTTDEYFNTFYDNLSKGLIHVDAYKQTEKIHFSLTGRYKYLNYPTFRRMKHRYLTKRRK